MMNVFWQTTLTVLSGRSLVLLGMRLWFPLCASLFLHQTKRQLTSRIGVYAFNIKCSWFGGFLKMKETAMLSRIKV